MNAVVNDLCTALDQISAQVLAAWSDDRTLREVHGWHHPALTRQDLAAVAANLAKKIRDAAPEQVDSLLVATLTDFPRRLKLLYTDTIPHMFNGNGHQAIPAYTETLDGLERLLAPVIGWIANPENKTMPASLARRLRSYEATLDSLVPNTEQLKAQLTQIQEATEAAESLPTDLLALADAKKKVDKFAGDAAELYGKLDERGKEVARLVGQITAQEIEAAKLVQQCEQAYRITTTKGLAAAFDQRAFRIAFSMWVWVLGLVVALLAATYLGAERVKLLSIAMTGDDPKWGIIWMQAILSILSVGAPLWFGWVATKQIAQRFRLAEDYGFKASVAKAYEGYRREAARLDPTFEARLFSSALSRLEEAPLRLVEADVHGSPWHELIASDAFRDAMKVVPNLREKFINITQKGVAAVRPKTEAINTPPSPETP